MRTMDKFKLGIKIYLIGMIVSWMILTATVDCTSANKYDYRSCGERVTATIYADGVIWPFYWLFTWTHPNR